MNSHPEMISSESKRRQVHAPLNVTYKVGNQEYLGDLYLPESIQGPLPLVLVIHEWWGKTEHPKGRAQRIANELGFAALAVDLYGDGKTVETPKEAQKLATPFYESPTSGVKLLQGFIDSAVEKAKKNHVILNTSKIAAIGFCFGGTQALNLARAGGLHSHENLVGVVSFHGGLSSQLKSKGPIHTKLLVLHAGADKMVTPEDVKNFKDEMNKAKANLEFHAYSGAEHAFTNPKATEIGEKYQIPVAYDADADQDSWKRMKTFLNSVLK